jgi:hypothetical protein
VRRLLTNKCYNCLQSLALKQGTKIIKKSRCSNSPLSCSNSLMLILSATVTGRQFSIILAVFLVVSNCEGEAVYSADDPKEPQARRKDDSL